MKIIITESQYITITEDIEKERYKKLVSELLKTLFGELTIEHEYDDSGKLTHYHIYDQHGEEFANIYLRTFANKGCKKDLTLTQESSEKLEGYIPYLRHKLFSKVLIELIDDKFKIKCDCIQYDYNFQREVRYSDDEDDDDEEEYEYVNYDTRKYNIKKKKKIKESLIKEDNLKTTLLNMIETDGWEDTSELVGGYENLLGIVGEDKIINLLLSCFSDLNVQKRGNDTFLLDWQLPILEKPSSFWGLPLKVFNDNIETRLEVKFGSDITKVYQNVRREFIRELVSLFPDLYTSDVNVYKDSGLYVQYDSFSL